MSLWGPFYPLHPILNWFDPSWLHSNALSVPAIVVLLFSVMQVKNASSCGSEAEERVGVTAARVSGTYEQYIFHLKGS